MTTSVLQKIFHLEWILSYVCHGYKSSMNSFDSLRSLASDFDGQRNEAKCSDSNEVNYWTICNFWSFSESNGILKCDLDDIWVERTKIFEEQLTSADRTHYEVCLKHDLILPEVSPLCLRECYHILHSQTQIIIDFYGPRRSDLQTQTITTGQQFKDISWRNISWIFLANMMLHKDFLEVISKTEEWATMCLIKKVLLSYREVIFQHDSIYHISVGSSNYSDNGTFQCTSTSPSNRGNYRKITARSLDGGM